MRHKKHVIRAAAGAVTIAVLGTNIGMDAYKVQAGRSQQGSITESSKTTGTAKEPESKNASGTGSHTEKGGNNAKTARTQGEIGRAHV